MEDYTKINLFNTLIDTNPNYNTQRLLEAFEWAFDLHKDQFRKSGQPYIIHPIDVAKELIKINLDEDAVIAALLHDVMEDCGVKYKDIQNKFGATVASLVEAETKVDQITNDSHIKITDYENLRRMLISMTDDVRVIIIRLSDRLHNMKTIEYLKPERRVTYSEETMNVYVPMCEYLGLHSWKHQLEDIAFKNMQPDKYAQLEELIKKDPRSSISSINNIKLELENLMFECKIPANISGRIKSVSSLNKKINTYLKKEKIEEYDTKNIFDFLAFRIITVNNNIIDCYKALGAIHAKYEYIPEEFDDYISRPKANGYQSLQTDIYVHGVVIEVQIRTKQMHEFNEFGSASHIAYKNNPKVSNKLSWIKELGAWEKHSYSIKKVLSNKIYVFTPKGLVIEMPIDSTVIDFAYRIHSDIGNSCTSAKINGHIVALNTKIKTGEIIEIITSKNKKLPSAEWVHFTLPITAAKIKRELAKTQIQEQIQEGKRIFEEKMLNEKIIPQNIELQNIYNDLSGGVEDEFYRNIYLKNISPARIITQYFRQKSNVEKVFSKAKKRPVNDAAILEKHNIILINGHKNMQYYLAKCCSPTSSDKVVGFISLEHGVTVHTKACHVLQYLNKDRLIDVAWG